MQGVARAAAAESGGGQIPSGGWRVGAAAARDVLRLPQPAAVSTASAVRNAANHAWFWLRMLPTMTRGTPESEYPCLVLSNVLDRAGSPLPGRQQDYPVVIGVQHVARLERDMAERHGNINGACAGFRALARVGAQCLDAEIEMGQRRAVADRPMQDQARPAVGLCRPRDQVAHERCAQGAATVHDQNAA